MNRHYVPPDTSAQRLLHCVEIATLDAMNPLIALILEQLQSELATALNASDQAHASATHSENVPENQYDTLALEAAYLAHGLSVRVTELRS